MLTSTKYKVHNLTVEVNGSIRRYFLFWLVHDGVLRTEFGGFRFFLGGVAHHLALCLMVRRSKCVHYLAIVLVFIGIPAFHFSWCSAYIRHQRHVGAGGILTGAIIPAEHHCVLAHECPSRLFSSRSLAALLPLSCRSPAALQPQITASHPQVTRSHRKSPASHPQVTLKSPSSHRKSLASYPQITRTSPQVTRKSPIVSFSRYFAEN